MLQRPSHVFQFPTFIWKHRHKVILLNGINFACSLVLAPLASGDQVFARNNSFAIYHYCYGSNIIMMTQGMAILTDTTPGSSL